MSQVQYFTPNGPDNLASDGCTSSHSEGSLKYPLHDEESKQHHSVVHEFSPMPSRLSGDTPLSSPAVAHFPHSQHSRTSPDGDMNEKEEPIAQTENIRTIERVGTHTNYYEKDGLRTEGDGREHHIRKLGARGWLALFALSFLWTGSQIPVYLFGSSSISISYDRLVLTPI